MLWVLAAMMLAVVANATAGDWRYPAGVLVAIFAFGVAVDVWVAVAGP